MKNETEIKIVVWGCGYIGLSDLAYYSNAGFDCYGIDTNTEIKSMLMRGEYRTDLLEWLDIDVIANINDGKIKFCQIPELPGGQEEFLHIISVPSEKNGEPDMTNIDCVLKEICDFEKNRPNKTLNVMIESTMVPGTAAKCLSFVESKIGEKEIYFCVAPRRDWFVSKDKDMKRLHRIFGTNSKQANAFFESVLSKVCDNLVMALDFNHSEVTKSIENAFRHMDITLANQLSDAFPNLDIRHVLELVGTKWNIDTYFPSFGTGGYCIPLSSRYVLAASEQNVPLLRETVKYDSQRPKLVAEAILKNGHNCIGILGLTYKKDIKVDKNCPISAIINSLKENGVDICIYDSLYDAEEIQMRYPGCKTIDSVDKEIVDELDALVIYTDHTELRNLEWDKILEGRSNKLTVYDNCGMFENLGLAEHENLEYHLVGKMRSEAGFVM